MATIDAIKEYIWLKGSVKEFGVEHEIISINCDNLRAFHLAKHQVFHDRSKHIDVRLHFVKDIVNKGEVRVVKVST